MEISQLFLMCVSSPAAFVMILADVIAWHFLLAENFLKMHLRKVGPPELMVFIMMVDPHSADAVKLHLF